MSLIYSLTSKKLLRHKQVNKKKTISNKKFYKTNFKKSLNNSKKYIDKSISLNFSNNIFKKHNSKNIENFKEENFLKNSNKKILNNFSTYKNVNNKSNNSFVEKKQNNVKEYIEIDNSFAIPNVFLPSYFPFLQYCWTTVKNQFSENTNKDLNISSKEEQLKSCDQKDNNDNKIKELKSLSHTVSKNIDMLEKDCHEHDNSYLNNFNSKEFFTQEVEKNNFANPVYKEILRPDITWIMLRVLNLSLRNALYAERIQSAYKTLLRKGELDPEFLRSLERTNYTINGKSLETNDPHEILNLLNKEVPDYSLQQLISNYTKLELLNLPREQLVKQHPEIMEQTSHDFFTTYEIDQLGPKKFRIVITQTAELDPTYGSSIQAYGIRTAMIITKHSNPELKYSIFTI